MTTNLESSETFTFVRRLFSDITLSQDRTLKEGRLSAQLLEWSQSDLNELFVSLETNEQGLSTEAAEKRLEKIGPNEVSHEKTSRWYVMFLKNFYNPFIVLLCVLAAAGYFLRDKKAV